MAQILDMPRLSDTMKEGVLRKWHKKEGDKLSPGDVIAEVDTDKATMDFESFDEGVLLKRLVGDGQAVPVGGPVAIIGEAGEDIGATLEKAKARSAGGGAADAGHGKGTNGATAKAEAPKAAPRPAPAQEAQAPRAVAPKPAAPKPAAPSQRPSGGAQAASGQPVGSQAGGGKLLASPLARRLATDLGIDLRQVKGSGPGGRIVERDVQAAAEGHNGGQPVQQPTAASAVVESAQMRSETNGRSGQQAFPEQLVPERRAEARSANQATRDEDTTKPLSLMRRTIARRMVESKTTVPHFYLTAEVDMDEAMAFREQISQVHGAKLSVNDLVIKAAALALRRVPEANASFTDEAIVLHGKVDIGMAVALEDGLVTPVIREADRKTLGQIANEARALAEKARNRKLRPEEMTGSTFSVSNLGMFGISDFSAIINPPEAAILAVGTVRKEPVVRDDKVVVGQRMSLTLSCDHRVLDGAVGAKLLSQIVAILQRPISLAF